MTEKTSLMAGASARAMTAPPIGGFNPMLRGAQVVFSPADEGGGGGLSIDDAVALLDAGDAGGEDDQATGAEAAAGGGQEQNPEGDASPPEEAAAGAENPAGEGGDPEQQPGDAETEGKDAAVAPAEAPKYWSQEAKARFAELSPDLQAVVLAQEGPREAAAAKAKDEAAQARTAADKDRADIQTLAQQLQGWLPKAVETFRSRWGSEPPDWQAYAQRHGTEQMVLAKERYESQRAELQRAAQATQEAEAKAHAVFLEEETRKLGELVPEFADPKEGPARRKEVGQYLVDQGIPVEALRNITAVEMSLARKAMLWDRAQAKSSSPNPNPPSKAKPGAKPPLTRGGAGQGPTDPKAKAASTAKNRFVQTRSVEDAIALLNAQDD